MSVPELEVSDVTCVNPEPNRTAISGLLVGVIVFHPIHSSMMPVFVNLLGTATPLNTARILFSVWEILLTGFGITRGRVVPVTDPETEVKAY